LVCNVLNFHVKHVAYFQKCCRLLQPKVESSFLHEKKIKHCKTPPLLLFLYPIFNALFLFTIQRNLMQNSTRL
jgi:hypothetical protein